MCCVISDFRYRARARCAFTLIEVVLAIGIAIGIMLVLLFFYSQAANLRAQLVQEAERLSTIRLLMDRITMELRTSRPHAFFEATFIGDTQFVQFVRTDLVSPAAWKNGERVSSAQTDLKLVRYSVITDTNTAAGLYREEEPLVETRTVRSASPTVDVAPVKPPEPLSEEVRYLHFRYWDGAKWIESWDGPKMPFGVEISIGFEPPVADEQGNISGEIFRRVVYLPGANAKHPEFTPVTVVGGTNEVRL
jgi:type II secretory pathway pseudopilin PulG